MMTCPRACSTEARIITPTPPAFFLSAGERIMVANLCMSAVEKSFRNHRIPRSAATPKSSVIALSHLREQLLRAAIAPRRQRGQRLDAAGRIGGGGPQQLAQFAGGTQIEAAIGPTREADDLAKRLLGDRIVAFLEHEGRDAAQPGSPS